MATTVWMLCLLFVVTNAQVTYTTDTPEYIPEFSQQEIDGILDSMQGQDETTFDEQSIPAWMLYDEDDPYLPAYATTMGYEVTEDSTEPYVEVTTEPYLEDPEDLEQFAEDPTEEFDHQPEPDEPEVDEDPDQELEYQEQVDEAGYEAPEDSVHEEMGVVEDHEPEVHQRKIPPRKPCPGGGADYQQWASLQVGSIRGVAGVNYPKYREIPLTKFTCAGKKHIPGFYADLETGCQVFHVCWPHRRESFLCPVGTIFNQAILACDYWYSANCSLSPAYYDVNAFQPEITQSENVGPMVDVLVKEQHTKQASRDPPRCRQDVDVESVLRLLPVKAKVAIYPEVPQPKPTHRPAYIPRPVSHWVKQKRVVGHGTKVVVKQPAYRVVQDVLTAAGSVAKQASRMIPKIVEASVQAHKIKTKPKLVFVPQSPQVQVQPKVRVVVRPHLPSTTTMAPKRKPLPTIDPKFVVKPIEAKVRVEVPKPVVKPVRKIRTKVVVKNASLKHAKSQKAARIVYEALRTANAVGQSILPLTRDALAHSYVKVWKSKKY